MTTADARLDAAREFLLRAFETACLAHDLTASEQATLLREIAAQHLAKSTSSLPDVAPERWEDRDKTKRENAVAFTRRVYGQWLGRGLTRTHLRRLDPAAYQALAVWEHRHPADRISELPTNTEVLDRRIAALSAEFTIDELRNVGSALQGRIRRERDRAEAAAPPSPR